MSISDMFRPGFMSFVPRSESSRVVSAPCCEPVKRDKATAALMEQAIARSQESGMAL